MSHTVKDIDGMRVLVVHDMDRRFDEDGKLISKKEMEDVELVHATEIARYYGIPLRTVGKGDNEVPGVWHLVHTNEIGQRVPYNNEETRPDNRNVRTWNEIKDATGKVVDTKDAIKRYTTHHQDSGLPGRERVPLVKELDDGMYVRRADLIEYAEAQGWKRGGGRPGAHATRAPAEDTNAKLDKLTELVTGLATIVAQQVVVHPAKGTK